MHWVAHLHATRAYHFNVRQHNANSLDKQKTTYDGHLNPPATPPTATCRASPAIWGTQVDSHLPVPAAVTTTSRSTTSTDTRRASPTIRGIQGARQNKPLTSSPATTRGASTAIRGPHDSHCSRLPSPLSEANCSASTVIGRFADEARKFWTSTTSPPASRTSTPTSVHTSSCPSHITCSASPAISGPPMYGDGFACPLDTSTTATRRESPAIAGLPMHGDDHARPLATSPKPHADRAQPFGKSTTSVGRRASSPPHLAPTHLRHRQHAARAQPLRDPPRTATTTCNHS